MRVLGVIPARYGSTRFPGKPLASLRGRPLVAHVVDNARRATRLDRVVVATDDERIVRAVEAAGAEARLTPADLPSGSDRAAWTARELAGEGYAAELVVNLQGDEPLLPGEAMDLAVETLLADEEAQIGTLAAPARPDEVARPQVVKVVLDGRGRALYFSRSEIPYPRDPKARRTTPLKHLGLYVYRFDYLQRYVTLGVSELEAVEGLEQLRALEDGARIAVRVGRWEALGVDTPADLAEAERRLAGE